MPTRLARHGMALAPLPERRFRFDLRHGVHALDEAPLVEGCSCPACRDHTRAYVHYLVRRGELTGVRLLSLHNLAYLERLVSGAREAIAAGAFGRYAAAIADGAAPWGQGSVQPEQNRVEGIGEPRDPVGTGVRSPAAAPARARR